MRQLSLGLVVGVVLGVGLLNTPLGRAAHDYFNPPPPPICGWEEVPEGVIFGSPSTWQESTAIIDPPMEVVGIPVGGSVAFTIPAMTGRLVLERGVPCDGAHSEDVQAP